MTSKSTFKSLLIIVALLSGIVNLSAQGRYTSRLAQNGTIYFLEPKKLTDVTGIKKFEFDITYVTTSDSAFVNFTTLSDVAVKPADIRLVYGSDNEYECNDSRLLFIDRNKSKYEIRMMCRLPITVIRSAFTSGTAPVFRFSLDGRTVSATYKPSVWKKERSQITEMFNLIDITNN